VIIIHDEIIQRWKEKQEEMFELLVQKGRKVQQINATIKTAYITIRESNNVNDIKNINIKIKNLEENLRKVRDEIAYLTGATEYLRNILHDINENNKGS